MCYCESACCDSITRINTRGTYSYKNRMLRGRESTDSGNRNVKNHTNLLHISFKNIKK